MIEKNEKQPFLDNEEYLEALIYVETIRLQAYFNKISFDEDGVPLFLNPFAPSPEEVNRTLAKKLHGFRGNKDTSVLQWELYIASREEVTRQEENAPSLWLLMEHLGFNYFQKGCFILALMCGIEPELRSIIRFFTGSSDLSYPTIEFFSTLYFQDKEISMAEKNRMCVETVEKLAPFFFSLKQAKMPLEQVLTTDTRFVEMFMQMKPWFTVDSHRKDPLWYLDLEKKRILDFFTCHESGCIFLYGEEGAGKKHLVAHAMGDKGQKYLMVKLEPQEEEDSYLSKENEEKLFAGIRESIVFGTVLVVVGLEHFKNTIQQQIIDGMTQSQQIVICISNQEEVPSAVERVMTIGLSQFDEDQRKKLWMEYSKIYQLEEEVELTYISNTFSFSPGKIKAALALASMERGGAMHPISKDAIYRSCYRLVDHKLSEKAKRVKSTFLWDDLKLPKHDKDLLRDLCNRVKNKHIVMSEWGFSQKLPYGSGISAVFAGPPGTGKTMAASVIANELHMEMYQIDLSQVVDKYIGETEKNIKLIFEQAKKSNSILFFDEADSLFAKRVESKSSNDRFANIESSMLLQCVEQYPGISILATNNYASIDPAFIRRLKYLVNFKMPDEPTRFAIWQSVFPKAVPIAEDVNLRFYARQFEFSGAYIKNIALAATYLAAEEGGEVEHVHLLKAISRELMKEGRRLEQGQLEQYGYLYPEVVG